MFGPRELERDAVRDRAQTVEALEAFETLGETHVVQLAHRARREPVPAGLLAWKALLDDEHVPTTRREPVRRGRAARSGADDEHVVRLASNIAHSAHDHMPERRETKREKP